ncbi:unnamed protein product [Sphenostylis stenocarpa]|uniref:Uncharacterized protein n=1 Tax=Sphenostylis stenocarpa TaxID=92480 RepID=A0AA86RW20_9FABA|nr:unnamed protein product [Sphenostylis stenocarpa]
MLPALAASPPSSEAVRAVYKLLTCGTFMPVYYGKTQQTSLIYKVFIFDHLVFGQVANIEWHPFKIEEGHAWIAGDELLALATTCVRLSKRQAEDYIVLGNTIGNTQHKVMSLWGFWWRQQLEITVTDETETKGMHQIGLCHQIVTFTGQGISDGVRHGAVAVMKGGPQKKNWDGMVAIAHSSCAHFS